RDALKKTLEPQPLQIRRRSQRHQEVHCGAAHRGDITHVRRNRFVGDGSSRVEIPEEVRVFGNEIRAEDDGAALGNVDDRGIVTDTDGQAGGLRTKSLSDLADESAFTEIAQLHAVTSAPLRKRLGPRTILPGFLASSSAALKTLLTSSTKMN